jgi:hypothetical protein
MAERTVAFVAAAVLVGFTAAALWPIPPSEPPRIVPFATEFELQASSDAPMGV